MRLREAVAMFRGQREFRFNLIGRRWVWFALTAAVIAISAIGLTVRGLNLGIDFRGGAVLQYPNQAGLTSEEIRATLADLGRGDSVVQLVRSPEGEETVEIRTESLGEDRTEVLAALAEQAGLELGDVSVEDIGPKWGQQISAKALQGLLIFLVVVSIYIALRFEWKMAVAALAAMFHDLIVTAGVYALVGREVTPETVIAILTILGYSLYDTVVIFDKVKENAESQGLVAREGYSRMVNLSLNQVLMRSVNTSLVVLLPVGALMLFGGETLRDFAFALFVGLLSGAYSSVFLAAPLVAVLKEREPRLAAIRERVERKAPRPELRAVPAPSRGEGEEGEPDRERVSAGVRTGGPSRPPAARRRPKKKPRSKRRRR
jgi:preprotein translocase subunit SecF